MPVEQGQEAAVATPAATPDPGVAPPVAPTIPFPNPALFRQPVAPGLRGAQRWEYVKRSQPGVFAGPAAYQTWLKSLPDDPGDPEYQAELDRARKLFLVDNMFTKSREYTNPAEGSKSFEDAVKRFNEYNAGTQPILDAREGNAAAAGRMDTGAVGATGKSAGGLTNAAAAGLIEPSPQRARIDKELDRIEKPQAQYLYKQPVFRGRAVGTDELWQPQGPQDAYLSAFLSENGIVLPGDDRNKSLRSGKYVLVGSETSKELGVSRDVYLYVEDAQAAGMNVDPNKLGSYQKSLGLTVTGKMDPYMLGVWDKAVEFASRSAQAGQKMTVLEWFDIFMQGAIAQKNASGAGGGGGGAAALEEFDYYRAMMQILGDISGVEG